MARLCVLLLCWISVCVSTALAASVPAQGAGLVVSPQVYNDNLVYVRDQALPVGWQLNPVLKWHAYGHNESQMAGVAAKFGAVSVQTNEVARAVWAAANKAGIQRPVIWRLMNDEGPANYSAILEAAKSGMGIQETMTPGNQRDILAAAKAAGVVIPVHIYLYDHYGTPHGYNLNLTSEARQLVNSLDPKLVKVVGFMVHNGGLTSKQGLKQAVRFSTVVCLAAQELAKQHPIMLHYASSQDIYYSVTAGNTTRMQAPANLCQVPNITWAARIGEMTYGMQRYYNGGLRNNTSPALTWYGTVTAVRKETGPKGKPRKVATVDVTPGRYPAPQWWSDVAAFIPETADTVEQGIAARHQPDSFVYIKGQRYQLADIPINGSRITVNVTQPAAGGQPVAVGDRVCILCEQHTLADLGREMGVTESEAAYYNSMYVVPGLLGLYNDSAGGNSTNGTSAAGNEAGGGGEEEEGEEAQSG